MAVQKVLTIHCDICGHTSLETYGETTAHARVFARGANWITRKVKGRVVDVCPGCMTEREIERQIGRALSLPGIRVVVDKDPAQYSIALVHGAEIVVRYDPAAYYMNAYRIDVIDELRKLYEARLQELQGV